MKKLSFVLLLILSTLLCSCGSKAPANAPVKENEAKSIDYSSLSDNLFSYDILLDGKKYTLPVKFSELAADGWTIDPKTDKTALGHSFYVINITLIKDKEEITASFINNDSESGKLDTCDVGSISTFGGVASSKVSMVLPKGISFSATEEEITAAYGKPVSTGTNELYDTYKYIDPNAVNKDFQLIQIFLDKKNHTFKGCEVENMYPKEETKK